jgi:DNA-nicking Smr family endonuclease
MTHEMPVEGVLDLHTFAARDVTSVVDEYVRVAAGKGLSEVRLIHGRGIGRQRAAVHRVLATHPDVLSYYDASESHLGATVATLRSSRG